MEEENVISKIILDSAFKIHTKLGSGLLEKVYGECLAYELVKEELFVEQEVAMPVIYESVKMDCGFRIDLLVEKKVIIEHKVVENFTVEHIAQTLTYMRFADCKLGLYSTSTRNHLKTE